LSRLTITPSWTPTAENVARLPEPIRVYLLELEATAFARGARVLLLEEQLEAFAARLRELVPTAYAELKVE
jgi:hypothetical protein